MKRSIADQLAAMVRAGKTKIGQLQIAALVDGFEIRHRDDAGRTDLTVYTSVAEARLVAIHDDQGKYRPLKTAPNLKHGWSLVVKTAEELRLALDSLYPAQAGMLQDFTSGNLTPVSFRETLNRQTGMYRITRLLTDDQAQQLIAATCTSSGGCLRTILWSVDKNQLARTLSPEKFDPSAVAQDEMPLLCKEACNILVAAGRPVAKSNLPKKP